MNRTCATRSSPSRFEFFERGFELHLEFLAELHLLADSSQQTFLPRLEPILQLELEFLHSVNWHSIDISVLHRPHNDDLLRFRNWTVLLLLKKLHNSLTAIESLPYLSNE